MTRTHDLLITKCIRSAQRAVSGPLGRFSLGMKLRLSLFGPLLPHWRFLLWVGMWVSSWLLKQCITYVHQCGNILSERIPYSGNIERTVSMNVKVTCIFNNPPRDRWSGLFDGIRKLRRQLTNLHNTHAAGILKHAVRLKTREVIGTTLQILCDTTAISNDFS